MFAGLRLAAVSMAALFALNASVQAQDYGITLYRAQGTGTYFGVLVEAKDGNFYCSGNGIVRLTVDGVATVIAPGYSSNGLLLGNDGNLYGVTGGSNTTLATVFQVTTAGTVTVIGTIPAAYNLDHEGTLGPLVQDRAGNFYGVIADGGTLGNGLVFGMAPDGTFSVVHEFSITDPQTTFNVDGNRPSTGLVIDGSDTLYGLTYLGGANGSGTIYSAGGGGDFSAAYSFPTYAGTGANLPIAIDSKGTVYFASSLDSIDTHVVTYSISSFSGGAPVPLYTFTPLNQTPGVNGEFNSDGGQPNGLTIGPDGNLYGVCGLGGPTSNGTTFRLTPGGTLTVLYPAGAQLPPTLGTDGNLYGTLSYVGQYFYRLESTLNPVISSVTSLTVPLGTPVSYQITATNSPTSFSADNLPDELTLAASTGLITGLPPVGTYTFDVGAENAFGSGYATVTLTVTAPSPDAPVITVPASPLTASVGAPFSYQIDASKSPSMYSGSGLPPGLTVDPNTGLIHGTAANFGNFLVQIQAANASGTGVASLEIDVSPAAAAPTVTVTGSDPNAVASTHTNGAFVVTLSAASGVDLNIAYTVKGSATPGVDYKPLPGTVTVPAGATSAKIKVKPKAAAESGGTTVIKLTLQAGTGYLVGTPDPVKVKIKQ